MPPEAEEPAQARQPEARGHLPSSFGKMLGHLQSAKSRLETDKGWRSTELQQKAQQRLEAKLSNQKLGIIAEKPEATEPQPDSPPPFLFHS